MLRTLLLFIALLPVFAKAQEASINWMTIEEAQEAQKKNPQQAVVVAGDKKAGTGRLLCRVVWSL